jgi:hypothetical protein
MTQALNSALNHTPSLILSFTFFKGCFMISPSQPTNATNASTRVFAASSLLRRAAALLVLLPMLALFAASCSQSNSPAGSSKTDLITAKEWKIQALPKELTDLLDLANGIVVLGGGPANLDFATQILNAKWKYNTDGTLRLSTTALGVGTGTWKFQNNETELVESITTVTGAPTFAAFNVGDLIKGFGTGTFKVESLTATELKITQLKPIDGTSKTFTFTLVPA